MDQQAYDRQVRRLEGRWALVRGTPIYYRVDTADGSRIPILHVHGFAISGSYMVPTAELLAAEFPTYVPDLPGFGHSPRPAPALDIPQLADTVAAFLDSVAVDRAVLVGNSLGCAIVSSVAQRHPDRIERAVLVSPAGGRHSRPLLRALYQLVQDAPREPLSMAGLAIPDYLQFGLADTYRLFLAMTRFPAFEALLDFRIPVLAVLGARDPLLPPTPQIKDVAHQLVPHLTLAVVREAAHAINYSHPRELAALVRAFVYGEPMSSTLLPPAANPPLSPVAVLQRDAQGRVGRL